METDPADTDPADEVKLSPPDPLVVKRPNAHDLSAGQDNQHPPVSPDLQFSLFELLGLMAFAAVMFTGFRYLSPPLMALVMGVLLSVTMGITGWLPARRTWFVMAWVLMLITYIVTCIFAIATK